jgi:hypothetical protein
LFLLPQRARDQETIASIASKLSRGQFSAIFSSIPCGLLVSKRLTENELSDFRRLWHDGCGETIIEAQDVDRNHSPEV